MKNIDNPAALIKSLSFYYDSDWIDWEPELLKIALIDNFSWSEEDIESFEKLEGIRALLRDNTAFENIVVFENVAHALYGTPFTAGYWEPCSMSEILYFFYVAKAAAGDEVRQELADSIAAYIASCLVLEGIYFLPKEMGLDFSEDHLARTTEFTASRTEEAFELWNRVVTPSFSASYEDVAKAIAMAIEGKEETNIATCFRKLAAVVISLSKRGILPSEIESLTE